MKVNEWINGLAGGIIGGAIGGKFGGAWGTISSIIGALAAGALGFFGGKSLSKSEEQFPLNQTPLVSEKVPADGLAENAWRNRAKENSPERQR